MLFTKSSQQRCALLQGLVALSASRTAYSAVPGKNLTDAPALAGGNVGLAALVQSRNGARVAVVGSVDLFSDNFCQASVPAGDRCLRICRMVDRRVSAVKSGQYCTQCLFAPCRLVALACA